MFLQVFFPLYKFSWFVWWREGEGDWEYQGYKRWWNCSEIYSWQQQPKKLCTFWFRDKNSSVLFTIISGDYHQQDGGEIHRGDWRGRIQKWIEWENVSRIWNNHIPTEKGTNKHTKRTTTTTTEKNSFKVETITNKQKKERWNVALKVWTFLILFLLNNNKNTKKNYWGTLLGRTIGFSLRIFLQLLPRSRISFTFFSLFSLKFSIFCACSCDWRLLFVWIICVFFPIHFLILWFVYLFMYHLPWKMQWNHEVLLKKIQQEGFIQYWLWYFSSIQYSFSCFFFSHIFTIILFVCFCCLCCCCCSKWKPPWKTPLK